MGILTEKQLFALGLASCGKNVRIDSSVQIFGARHLSIADNVRIDCFGIISAGPEGVFLGSYIHIAAGCYLFGNSAAIELEDFCGLSSRVSIYSSSDDYVSGAMTGPTVPQALRQVTVGKVLLRRHVIVGAGSVILPAVTVGLGAAVGALTVVRKSVSSGSIVYGNPAMMLPKKRNVARLLHLESQLRGSPPAARDDPTEPSR